MYYCFGTEVLSTGAGIRATVFKGWGCAQVGDERWGSGQDDVRRTAMPRVRGRRTGSAAALRQAVWIDVIEQISALLAEDRELTSILADVAREILDGFRLRAVAIGIVDGPWIEYRGVATERHSIAHRTELQASLGDLASTPYPTEILLPADAEDGESRALTPLVRLPIRVGSRIVAALIVEIDPDHELDVDDIDALAGIAQIIGHGLVRGDANPPSPAEGANEPEPPEQLEVPTGLASLTPHLLAGWASRVGAVALRVVIDDWSGTWVVSGVRDGSPALDPPLTRLLAVPAVRRARKSSQQRSLPNLAESPEYDPASGIASAAIIEPIQVDGEPAGVVIAEVGNGVESVALEAIAETVARLVEDQRQRFNAVRAGEFVQVLDRVGHLTTLELGAEAAFEALASVIYDVLGLDAGYGVIRGDRLYFEAPQRDEPVPGWFREGIPLELGVTGRVALTGQAAFLPDVLDVPEYLDLGNGVLSEFCVPVFAGGVPVGVFNVESTARRLDDVDVQLLKSVFDMVAGALGEEGFERVGEPEFSNSATGGIDPVTGVPDDSYFYRRLADQLEVVRRTGLPASVFIVEVTPVEDPGPAVDLRGAILREASQRLVDQLRGEDLVTVRGADRLAVLLPGVSAGSSINIGERLAQSIEGRPLRLPDGETFELRCAVGIATTVIGAESPEVLVVNAVMALEQVKENARNRVGHYRDVEFGTLPGND